MGYGGTAMGNVFENPVLLETTNFRNQQEPHADQKVIGTAAAKMRVKRRDVAHLQKRCSGRRSHKSERN